MMDKSKLDNMNFLSGEELDIKIDNTEDNDRSLVRYDRNSKDFKFPECEKCGAPRIVHRNMDLSECVSKPTEDDLNFIDRMLRECKGIEKFALNQADDNIEKYGRKSRQSAKRNRSVGADDNLPEGKKKDEKRTPIKQVELNER